LIEEARRLDGSHEDYRLENTERIGGRRQEGREKGRGCTARGKKCVKKSTCDGRPKGCEELTLAGKEHGKEKVSATNNPLGFLRTEERGT